MYKIRKLLSCAIFLLFLNNMTAQVEKTFFQTYDIPHEVRRIKIQSTDTYELRPWNGVQLMIETTVQLDGGNMNLLSILIKDGRYNFEFEKSEKAIDLHAKLPTRPQIKQLGQICRETVKMLIYIPEEFVILSNSELIQKETLVAKDK
jgi:hypothetical protein